MKEKYDIIIVAEKIGRSVKISNPHISNDLVCSGFITNSLRSSGTLDLSTWEGSPVLFAKGYLDSNDVKKSIITSDNRFNSWYDIIKKELVDTQTKVLIIKKGFNE